MSGWGEARRRKSKSQSRVKSFVSRRAMGAHFLVQSQISEGKVKKISLKWNI